VFCVIVECVLNTGGVWLIFLFGYFEFFVAINLVLALPSTREKVKAVAIIYAVPLDKLGRLPILKRMKSYSLFRVILSGVIGLVIGVIFTALVNLAMPATNLAWTLIPTCLAAILSGFAGYLLGARQKK
jgi:uncharacterized protein YacL